MLEATHIISALPLPVLDTILPSPLPHLLANPRSTVTVLNLVFAAPPTSRTYHPPGFGYLVPRPEDGYVHTHVPGVLGVVFDTAGLPEQDDNARFVKMTAMLGGPYASSSEEGVPASALLASVLPLISAQLGGDPLPPPVHYAVHRNVECIPTYLVGHTARMEELGRTLRERWGGRMEVVGTGVGGVSVADCVKAGREAAFQIAAQLEAH